MCFLDEALGDISSQRKMPIVTVVKTLLSPANVTVFDFPFHAKGLVANRQTCARIVPSRTLSCL